MMLTRPVIVFGILLAWSMHHSESAFDRKSCRDASEPSVAALVKKTDNKTDDEFFGGGSLISERFILTAAHCLQNKGDPEPRKPEDVNVQLGKWNLSDATEPNAVLATPKKFILHADWNVSDTRWDADIAIVKLSEDVTFSSSIQPVCLWTSEMQPEKGNDAGTVVGWGETENKTIAHSDVPMELQLEVLSIFRCYETDGLRDVISQRGLCVKWTGRGPCNGDSGGGFFTTRGGEWFLRGITSVSLQNVHMQCDVNAAAVFTNVEKFAPWIDQVLDGDEHINCTFKEEYYGYACTLQNSFTRRDTKISEVSGSHFGGRTNADVFQFKSWENSKLKFLPITLGRFFPNLQWYQVENSGVEEISRQNFADLARLKFIWIELSQLKVVPVDAFYDLGNLETLYLHRNQIEVIDSSTFIRNTKLKMVNLQSNKIRSLDSSIFKNNLKLVSINFFQNLITTIGPEILTPLKELQIANFSNNTCINKSWAESPNLYPSTRKAIKEMFASQCQ